MNHHRKNQIENDPQIPTKIKPHRCRLPEYPENSGLYIYNGGSCSSSLPLNLLSLLGAAETPQRTAHLAPPDFPAVPKIERNRPESAEQRRNLPRSNTHKSFSRVYTRDTSCIKYIHFTIVPFSGRACIG